MARARAYPPRLRRACSLIEDFGLVLGSKWTFVGTSKPSSGTEITNKPLEEALRERERGQKFTFAWPTHADKFTKAEIKAFGVTNLAEDSYIKVGDRYYQQAARDDNDIPDVTWMLIDAAQRSMTNEQAQWVISQLMGEHRWTEKDAKRLIEEFKKAFEFDDVRERFEKRKP